MSSKQEKKIRKNVRKNFAHEFGAGMEMLHKIIRKRPVWVPKRIWILLYMPLFKKQYRSLIYKYMD